VQRKRPDCRLKQANLRGFSSCPQTAQYRATLELSNGHQFTMDLCSEHMRNATRIAEIEAARMFLSAKVRVSSIRFDDLALADEGAKAS